MIAWTAAMSPIQSLGLVLAGLAIGALGTLIGAGGGFILVPLLAILYPRERAAILTATSLAVACANATSGSLAYARLRRVDFRSGLIFALAGLPGAILGAFATRSLDRAVFDPLLGAVLILGAGFILFRAQVAPGPASGTGTRRLVERDGTVHAYTPRLGLGIVLSAIVGFVSSLLGIGGGIIHVPIMVYALGFPTHIATATSHFVLALLALAGVLVHGFTGNLTPGLARTVPLVVGVLAGAPFGAWLSSRLHGRWILRSLAIALASVGVRLLLFR